MVRRSCPRFDAVRRRAPFVATVVAWILGGTIEVSVAAADELRIAVFQVDATPPIGSPVAYAATRAILDPLTARGVVLLTEDRPIVLCAVDWIGINNAGQDLWREKLAQAAGTTPERVAVHVLHQHDGPWCDPSAEEILAAKGRPGLLMDARFARDVVERAAAAVRQSVAAPRRVTHLGTGQARVEKVASNRRILGPDGKVAIVRYSKSKDPRAIAAPDGTIDPWLKLLCLYDGETPLAVLTYYATHPQSYYGQGEVTAEFVGLARALREQALPGVPHVHFNGASGNVAAGKYNDGSPEMRPVLAERMATGMRRAWEAIERRPIAAADVAWRTRPVELPVGRHLVETELTAVLDDPRATVVDLKQAARSLAFLRRCRAGRRIDVSCLSLGDVRVLHLPGELFVEYQLAAQKMRPQSVVCLAAYGDLGPGYIGTEIAYEQGGYETGPRASRVAPQVEAVLLDAIRELLK